jgi:Holliday junction resolvase RusA-like endonuclease
MMIEIIVPGEPVQFARAGSHGAQRFTPPKQRAAMALIAHEAVIAMEGRAPLEGPLEMEVVAEYLRPKSWSRERAATTKWKTSKPDLDNIVKLTKDALQKIVFVDDSQVALIIAKKCCADAAHTIITVTGLEGEEIE